MDRDRVRPSPSAFDRLQRRSGDRGDHLDPHLVEAAARAGVVIGRSGGDVGMAAENMMLAAKALGLDSCPIGLAKYVEQTKIFSRLQVPLSEQVHLAIILGYGDETPDIHKRIRENAFFIE